MTKATKAKREYQPKRGLKVFSYIEMGTNYFDHTAGILYAANNAFLDACNIALTGKTHNRDKYAVEVTPEVRERARALAELYSNAYELEVREYDLWDDCVLYASDCFVEKYMDIADLFSLYDRFVDVSKALLQQFVKAEALAFEYAFLLKGGIIEDMESSEFILYRLNLKFDLLECLHKCFELSKAFEDSPQLN